MTRRRWLMMMAAALAGSAERLPANRNIQWALGTSLWNSYPGTKFTDILDIMRDTGFIGLRLTQFPLILKTYDITAEQMEREVSRRGLHGSIKFQGWLCMDLDITRNGPRASYKHCGARRHGFPQRRRQELDAQQDDRARLALPREIAL